MLKTQKPDWVISIFYFSILFPFVSFYPIGSDLQPIFIIMALIVAIAKKITFYKHDSVLIIFAIFSLVYINPFIVNFIPYKGLGAYLSIFISIFTVLIFIKSLNINLFISILKKSIIIYFIGSILFYLAPDMFGNFQMNIVRNVNTLSSGIGFRGISTFCTEPGLFGGHMIGLLLILFCLFEKMLVSKKQLKIYGLMTLSMILMSKSGMGYSYLVILAMFLFFKYIKSYKVIIFIAIIAILIIPNLYLFLESNRGLSALLSLADYENIKDNSILNRLYNLFLGFYILVEYPFGMGFNYTNSYLIELINSNQFFKNYYGSISKYGFVSSTALLISYYGLSFFIFLRYIVQKYKTPLFYLVFSLLFLTFSFSAAYPIIWILIILSYLLTNSKIISK